MNLYLLNDYETLEGDINTFFYLTNLSKEKKT